MGTPARQLQPRKEGLLIGRPCHSHCHQSCVCLKKKRSFACDGPVYCWLTMVPCCLRLRQVMPLLLDICTSATFNSVGVAINLGREGAHRRKVRKYSCTTPLWCWLLHRCIFTRLGDAGHEGAPFRRYQDVEAPRWPEKLLVL